LVVWALADEEVVVVDADDGNRGQNADVDSKE
jgi:hypothetical protein